MQPTNDGDKEKQTPADNATGNKALENLSDEELEARRLAKIKQLSQLEIAAQEETIKLNKLRSEKRNLETDNLFGDVALKPKEKKDDDDEFADDGISEKVSVVMTQERAKERMAMYTTVIKEFISDHSEFSSENDIGQELYSEFIEKAKNMHLGTTERQVRENAQFILDGLLAKNKPKKEEKKIDSLGDIDTAITNKPAKAGDEWKTKKLNRHEQAAADNYPGGEKGYRLKMAELANKKSS